MRKIILLLAFLVSISCEGQDTFHSLISESPGGVFAIGVIGDSNADGSATTITSCADNTLYLWDGVTTTEITTQSVANNDNTKGSIWQPFANAYKSIFNKPVLLINGSQGGSTFSTGDYDWNTASGDTLYTNFVSKVSAWYAASGRSSLDAIIVNCGINDVRAGRSLANITTGANNLFTSLNTNFPGVPVLVVQVGRYETSTNDVNLYEIREMLVDQAATHDNVNIVCNASVFSVQSGYEADALHYNSTMQGTLGTQMARWFANSSYSKWARSVMSCMYDDPSSARKTLVDNFISSQVSNSNFFKIDQLLVFKTSHASNIEIDWSMITFGVTRTSTYNANSDISTDGSTTRYDATFSPSIYSKRTTVSDIIAGLKIKTASSVNPSFPFGTISTSGGTKVFTMGMTTSTNYRVNDGTLSLGAESSFAAGHLYSIARNGTTKLLIKDKTTNASTTQANTGEVIGFPVTIGCVNNAGTLQSFYQGNYEYFFVAEYSTFDLNSFYDEIETLITNW